ncbi:Crp/Fnr family transcriptional regulator [Comamonas nitrativorans]|uniref:Crp/Fnr family transcriptional regulator n=1 Tax=Comamonas nitrativorans TaxID=108437 RepID=A0ABV9GT44_9BURK
MIPMSRKALQHALSTSQIFSKADPAMLAGLVQYAQPVRLSAQQHLFIAGDEALHFYWIETGGITLYSPSLTGEEKTFRLLGAGALVAETMMYAQPCCYPLSAYANTDSQLYRMPREPLLAFTRQSAEFAFSLVEILASRITQAIHRIDLLTINNSLQRLVSYLLDMHAQQGTAWLQLPASSQVIARQLNITPETFSRHLSQLKRQGLVGRGRNKELVLLDIAGLCHEAGLPPPSPKDLRRPMAHLGGSMFECCNLL